MIKFIQIGCKERNGIDPAQAKAVLKHKPDIILFEFPQDNKTPETIFNKYPPEKKPKKELSKVIKILRTATKSMPWAESDIQVFENINKLWDEGKQVYLYFIDAPIKITSARLDENNKRHSPFPKIQKYLWWWNKMYAREGYMTKHLKWILKKHKEKDLKVLVFLEKFHWNNVQFRLKAKSKEEIQKYYFSAFK
ncbi:MAG: hypothetical protein Q8P93_00990 [bacterium]|nr:hypothetical protein [bacterium]